MYICILCGNEEGRGEKEEEENLKNLVPVASRCYEVSTIALNRAVALH